MMMRCVAIDDEPLALDVIVNYCNRLDSVVLVSTFTSVLEAISYLKNVKVDLIFLDINMPDINGMDLPKLLMGEPKIIYITAHEKYAFSSYDIGAVDFLLKPVPFDRFLRAINKISPTQPNISHDTGTSKIMVRSGKKMIQLNVKDISHIEGLKDYAQVFVSGKRYVIRESLKSITNKLKERGFVRVHRSFIVQIDKIEEVGPNYLQISDREIPVGKSYKDDLVAQLYHFGFLGER